LKAIRILVLGLILISIFSIRAFADSGVNYDVKEVDGYKIGLAFPGGMAQMGHNMVNMQIIDSQGQMVDNAKVTIVAELYADSGSSSGGGMNMNMGGSSATSSSTPEKPMQTMTLDMMPAQQAGQYQGELTLDQAGHWMLTVNSLINNQQKSVEFTEEISKGGPNMLVISIFAIVIVGIIAAAAITRRRSAKKAVPEGAK
jgi:hypothetical protein